jgi:hypothetical protein
MRGWASVQKFVLRSGCRGANRAPDSPTRGQDLFVGDAGDARVEIGQSVSSPDGVRVRIDEARNDSAMSNIDSGGRLTGPCFFGAGPQNSPVGHGDAPHPR